MGQSGPDRSVEIGKERGEPSAGKAPGAENSPTGHLRVGIGWLFDRMRPWLKPSGSAAPLTLDDHGNDGDDKPCHERCELKAG